MSQFRAIIRGRVQGVCYRAATVEAASALGLRGYARNRPDGSVEVVAGGDEAELEALLAFLKRGPSLARVDSVDVDWGDASPLPQTFDIRY